tara:strand:- start:2005 stop:2400 length:396 start_codon:yes stop_codon:yes gene_type:complete
MKERIKKSLLPIIGQNFKVSENKKCVEKKHKKHFIKIVDDLKNLNLRSNQLHEELGINLFYYEDAHYQIYENILEELYGPSVCKVIFWWVYDVLDPKDNEYLVKDEKTEKEYKVKTTSQLYDVIKKIQIFK